MPDLHAPVTYTHVQPLEHFQRAVGALGSLHLYGKAIRHVYLSFLIQSTIIWRMHEIEPVTRMQFRRQPYCWIRRDNIQPRPPIAMYHLLCAHALFKSPCPTQVLCLYPSELTCMVSTITVCYPTVSFSHSTELYPTRLHIQLLMAHNLYLATFKWKLMIPIYFSLKCKLV